jgi:hypothetical protein
MTEYVSLKDCQTNRNSCAQRATWKGSTLVTVFLAVALAVGTIGGMAIANGSASEANAAAIKTADKKHNDAQAERTAAQRREFDAIGRRLETIESLVRELNP